MHLLDNQNSEFKTQLHENSVIDLTQNFTPDKKYKKKKKKKKKISKMKVFRNILLDNHYNTTDQNLKLLRTQLEGIPLKIVFR